MKRHNLTQYLFSSIIEQKNINPNRPIIVAIDGSDCSGKTEFAQKLNEFFKNNAIKSEILAIDYFLNEKSIRESGELELFEKHYYHNYDYDKLGKILKQIQSLSHFEYDDFILDIENNTFTKKLKFEAESDCVVIVEGKFLLKNSLKSYFDYSIRLKIDSIHQIERALKKYNKNQEILDYFKDVFIPANDLYETINKPDDFANVIIDNNDTENPKILKEK